jgi:FKBP-type peptidyl-prolyl cis-trans isomerase
MNSKWLAIVIMFFTAFAAKAQDKAPAAQKAPEPASTTQKAPEQGSMTEKEKLSYGAGVQAGKNYLRYREQLDLELDIEMVVKGLKDAYNGAALKVSEEELKAVADKWNKDIQERQKEKQEAAAIKNKKDGNDFLAANTVKEGVMTLPSGKAGVPGVQYKEITRGNGPKPTEMDTVEVDFILSLIDGKELKEVTNTRKLKKTVFWQVGQNIPGMKAALMNMPVGSTWEVVIPPEQAYADKASGPIGPNSTLVFTIELKDIKKESDPKASTPDPTPDPAPK